MEEETQTPVYFARETPQLTEIYDDVKRSTSADSADSALEGSLSFDTSLKYLNVLDPFCVL